LVLAHSTREELRRRRRRNTGRFHRWTTQRRDVDVAESLWEAKVVAEGHKEAKGVTEGHNEAKVVAEGYTNTYVVAEGYWKAIADGDAEAVADGMLRPLQRVVKDKFMKLRIVLSVLSFCWPRKSGPHILSFFSDNRAPRSGKDAKEVKYGAESL
jgi:hypothetical protein